MTTEENNYRNYADSCAGVYPPEDFDGLWVQHWSNGQLKYRGQYKPGRKRIGQHICFWENGVLQELSYWDDGWVTGTLLRFNEDGSKDSEKDYGVHGGVTRSWVERWFDLNSNVFNITVWKNDEMVAEWKDPETRRIWDEIGGDQIVERAVDQMDDEQ